jgi:hypothetical protein
VAADIARKASQNLKDKFARSQTARLYCDPATRQSRCVTVCINNCFGKGAGGFLRRRSGMKNDEKARGMPPEIILSMYAITVSNAGSTKPFITRSRSIGKTATAINSRLRVFAAGTLIIDAPINAEAP